MFYVESEIHVKYFLFFYGTLHLASPKTATRFVSMTALQKCIESITNKTSKNFRLPSDV